MDVEKRVKEIEDLPESELNKELAKHNKEEMFEIINHLAGKLLQKRYEHKDSTKRN